MLWCEPKQVRVVQGIEGGGGGAVESSAVQLISFLSGFSAVFVTDVDRYVSCIAAQKHTFSV